MTKTINVKDTLEHIEFHFSQIEVNTVHLKEQLVILSSLLDYVE